ncbi:MAG: GNAT family N-acetyltransferase [Thermomicrobiales bacterium]
MVDVYLRNAVAIGDCIYLRLLEPADAQAIARASHLEPEIEFSDSGRVPATSLAFARWIERIQESAIPTELAFAICRIEDGQCIGSTSIRDIDWVHRTGETGTGLLNAEDRGRGLGPEAKHLLLRYCFHELGLHAIRSIVFPRNTRSVAALGKQGYRYAGKLSAFIQKGGAYHDDLVFDLLRPDWEAAYETWRAANEGCQLRSANSRSRGLRSDGRWPTRGRPSSAGCALYGLRVIAESSPDGRLSATSRSFVGQTIKVCLWPAGPYLLVGFTSREISGEGIRMSTWCVLPHGPLERHRPQLRTVPFPSCPAD